MARDEESKRYNTSRIDRITARFAGRVVDYMRAGYTEEEAEVFAFEGIDPESDLGMSYLYSRSIEIDTYRRQGLSREAAIAKAAEASRDLMVVYDSPDSLGFIDRKKDFFPPKGTVVRVRER